MKQRLIRVLVYEGSRKWIEGTIRQNAVKGARCFGDGIIKEAIIGDFLEEVIERQPEKTDE